MDVQMHKALLRAATLLERYASELRASHTVRGRWPKHEADVRAKYIEERRVARALRTAARGGEPGKPLERMPAALAALRSERERCASICDIQAAEWDSDRVQTHKNYAAHCAALIRSKTARG